MKQIQQDSLEPYSLIWNLKNLKRGKGKEIDKTNFENMTNFKKMRKISRSWTKSNNKNIKQEDMNKNEKIKKQSIRPILRVK